MQAVCRTTLPFLSLTVSAAKGTAQQPQRCRCHKQTCHDVVWWALLQASAVYWRLLAPLVEKEAASGAPTRIPNLLASDTFHCAVLALSCELVVASRRQVCPPRLPVLPPQTLLPWPSLFGLSFCAANARFATCECNMRMR